MKKYRIQINFKIPLTVKKIIEAKNIDEAKGKAMSLAIGYQENMDFDIEVIPYKKQTYRKKKK